MLTRNKLPKKQLFQVVVFLIDLKAICNPGPADQEDGDGAEDEEGERSAGTEADPDRTKPSSCLQRPTFVTSPAYLTPQIQLQI